MRILEKYTIPSLLDYAFQNFSDCKAFSFVDGKQNTYKDLQEEIAKIGNLLADEGIKKGDKVAILGTNSPTWVAAYQAIATLGAIVVPILPDFTDKEVVGILNHSEAKAIFISSKLYPKLENAQFDSLKLTISLENLALIPQGTTFNDFQSMPNPALNAQGYSYADVDEDDLLAIIYTSGTTGSSKGVMLSHKNIVWNAERGKEIQTVNNKDRFLSILPLSHTYENSIGMILGIMSGAATYYLQKLPTPSILLPALKKIRPTIMLTVPLIMEKIYRGKVLATINKKKITKLAYKLPVFRRILNKIAGKKVYESFGGCLHFFGIGGAKLDPTVEQFLLDCKFPYAIGYGMTEASPLIAGALVGKTKLGSTGEIIPELAIRLAKENPKDKAGEIQVKGPSVMKGYFKAPDKTAEAITEDGWLRTGDLGIIDAKGYIHIKGRIKTMIVGASGENIYPEEIESIINKMDLVLESLVTQRGGKLVAMVHLNMEELENRLKRLQNNVSNLKTDAIQKTDDAKRYVEEKSQELLLDIRARVNEELNKFSQIQQMILQPVPFEKTPTKKVKRFLYS